MEIIMIFLKLIMLIIIPRLKFFVLLMGLSLNIHEVLLRGEKAVMNVI